ncbi:MAG: peptide ABC transporter substrate-binding protein [Anaerolineae bacterium]|nr:peptide ABC transporter substrate-binding protein [Anaerolineae bacterium]
MCLLFAACTTPPQPSSTPTPTMLPPIPTLLPTPTLTPTPLPSTLSLCLGSEPTTLYLPEATDYAATYVLEALYDGPIDEVGYAYQPKILEKLPSLADGDAVISPITVTENDTIVDATGRVILLTEGIRVRPAGCRAPECELDFDGTPLQLDQMRVTFHLKTDLYWSDGEPVTAHDSVYSFELARDPATANYQWLEAYTAEYTALDAHTLIWVGMPGYLNPQYFLALWTPLPRHTWGNLSAAAARTSSDITNAPLGYGPYVINSWKAGKTIYTHRNPYYIYPEAESPFFNAINFRFINNQDVNIALDALEKGQCDVLSSDLDLERGFSRLQTMVQEGKAQIHAIPSAAWEHLTFNTATTNDRIPFFADERVRHAVAVCIQRQRLVDEVTQGLGQILDTYIPPDHPLYPTESIIPHTYLPEQGKEILTLAGWRDENGDGTREAHTIEGIPEGVPFQVEYVTLNSEYHQRIGEHIATDLANCGIQVQITTYDPITFFVDGPDTPLYGGNFDLAQFAWLTDPIPPCNLYLSAEIPAAVNNWSGQNFGGYTNSEYDDACLTAQAALPGEANFAAAHQTALHLFNQDLPAFPLFQRVWLSATRPDLQGFYPDALAPETWNIEGFRIE